MPIVDTPLLQFKVEANEPTEAGTIKFILPEFVSYLGERGVLCMGNG